jgi:hypothetical protein
LITRPRRRPRPVIVQDALVVDTAVSVSELSRSTHVPLIVPR